MSALVWGLEWRLALSSKRGLVLRVLAPLGIALVLATGAMPALAGAAGYTVLFATFGIFGVALPLIRDGERGIAGRIVRAGVLPSSYLIQRAAAGAALALVQLLPAAGIAAVFLHASTAEFFLLLGALALTLWIGGFIGVVTAAASRTSGEASLIGSVTLVLLLHMSGVFNTPSTEGFGAFLEVASPFQALHEAFVTMVTGGAVQGALGGLGWAVALPVVVGLLAPRLIASLQRGS